MRLGKLGLGRWPEDDDVLRILVGIQDILHVDMEDTV